MIKAYKFANWKDNEIIEIFRALGKTDTEIKKAFEISSAAAGITIDGAPKVKKIADLMKKT